jgi:outer membrane protein TolC
MKKLLLFFPLILFSHTFSELSNLINNSITYKLQQDKIKIYEKKLSIVQSKNYGSLDLEYNAIFYSTTPIMKSTLFNELEIGERENFIGTLKYSYPLFTGYMIHNSIEKSKLELIKEKLYLNDLKRNLLLNILKLYSNIYTIEKNINALKSAKKALLSAKNRATELFKEGLLRYSSLSAINAKYFNTVTNIKNLNYLREEVFNNLSYLLDNNISYINGLETFKIKDPNFESRYDVKVLKKSLEISDIDIKIVKSEFYPKIALETAWSRKANDILLSDNHYNNRDYSYIGIGINYNLFNGNESKNKLEIAKLSKIMNIKNYNNYLNKIKTEYKNDLNKLESLNYQLKSSISEVKANEDYLAYIDGKFNEGLESVTNLNDAIASLAEARAKRDSIKAKIFEQKVKLLINGGNYEFN